MINLLSKRLVIEVGVQQMTNAPNIALKREREQRNWSQEALAEQLETTHITISRWERGISSPSPHFRQKLCELFEKNAEELGFSQSQDPTPLPSDVPSPPQELDKTITQKQFSSLLLPSLERQNRTRLLKQVRAIWIEGLLEQSLHRAAWIDLHLQEQPDALENPWQLQVQELDREPHPLPVDTSIVEVYDEVDGKLLILGEPGSGKTTLLLQLARTLLDRALADERHQMPVIFNLSSWAQQQKPLATWLVDELKTKYQVPRQVAQDWVDADQVLPLLDGLDEVAKEARPACVQQINNYCQSRQTRGSSPIVVCCRSEEYAVLSTRIMLQQAVSILPFTDEQINTYLERAGEQIKGLRQALDKDIELHNLARQPLILNIFALAYQGAIAAEVPTGETREEMRQTIFARYVEHMLKRRGQSKRWKPEQVTHWLTFLAKQMQRHNQTVFSVENLQLTWLSRGRRLLPQLCVGLLGGLAGGLFVWLTTAALFSSSILVKK
jgi:predicted NACHT family NTPase